MKEVKLYDECTKKILAEALAYQAWVIAENARVIGIEYDEEGIKDHIYDILEHPENYTKDKDIHSESKLAKQRINKMFKALEEHWKQL